MLRHFFFSLILLAGSAGPGFGAPNPSGAARALMARLLPSHAESFALEIIEQELVSWCGDQLHLSNPLPVVGEKVRRVSPFKYRYCFNYCALEKLTTVGRVVLVAYYGDQRYYGVTIQFSKNGQHWDMMIDRSNNKQLSTPDGYTCLFPPRPAPDLRVKLTHNSANTGRHLVEVLAYEK